jgi:hypothetical protein
MAVPLTHILPGGDPQRGLSVITYGKCLKSPYRENGLWCVHVPRITDRSTTFLVSETYARPHIMDQYGTDLNKWKEIAAKVIPGAEWNFAEECLWHESPFSVHKLPDNTLIRYGLCRFQSGEHPDRRLYYIILNWTDEAPPNWCHFEMFVVDEICTTPAFLEKMGNHPAQWQRICWAHPSCSEPWNAQIDQVPSLNLIRQIGERSSSAQSSTQSKRSWWQKS